MPTTEHSLDAAPEVALDRFVTRSRHRFRLVLEDLAGLPSSPSVVVEGSQLLPTSVSAVLRSADQALFLVRGGDDPPARPLDERIAREARELRLTALTADRPLGEMIELAAEHLRPALERGPRQVDLADIRRRENDALALAKPDAVRVLFACECGASGCDAEVELTLADYAAVSASGDRSPLRAPTP